MLVLKYVFKIIDEHYIFDMLFRFPSARIQTTYLGLLITWNDLYILLITINRLNSENLRILLFDSIRIILDLVRFTPIIYFH